MARNARTPSASRSPWTTAADIEAKVRRRWMTGDLLRAFVLGEGFVPIDMPLRGPIAADLTAQLEQVRRWATSLERSADDGRAFAITPTTIGGRGALGRTEVPGRVRIDTFDQVWRILGVGGASGPVEVFAQVIAQAEATAEPVRAWALQHPLRAIDLAAEWPAIIAAYEWLEANRGSGRFIREVDAPEVDTKLVDRHRGLLCALLGVPGGKGELEKSLGLAVRPGQVRLRVAPGVLELPLEITEVTLRPDELARLRVAAQRVLIVENEVTFLSVPIPDGGMVIWGKGFALSMLAALGWLCDAAARGTVTYWGDLDTHGFVILSRLRGLVPGVRSVLMDRDTLLRHESRWGREPQPANVALAHLTEREHALYEDLVTDRYGISLRLEQERIDWAWVVRTLRSS